MRTPRIIPAIGAVGLAWLLLTSPGRPLAGEPGAVGSPSRRVRQPVALAVVDGGKTLLAANGRSGSLSVVDIASRKVVAEPEVGRGLADLAALPDGRRLLAVDRAAGELLLIDYHDRSPRVIVRTAVASDPVRVVVLEGGSSAVVASTWPRRLTFVSLAQRAPEDMGPALSIAGGLDLPFSPREMAAFADGSRLVVADAFGGRLAVVDLHRRAIDSIRSLPAHNIRGMAFSPDGRTLLLTHQVLSRLAQATFDDVHWGQLIRNHLRVLRVESLRAAGSDAALLDGGRLFDLGDVGYAAGDPGAIAFDRRGNLIVALEGMDEVVIAAGVDQGPRRVVVGRRPTAVAVSPDGEFAYVADSLDDTISVVATATGQRPATIALGPRPELTAAERGERLFSSAKVSHDGWMSCQSCHTDGHTNGLSSDTLGDGSYGAPKRVPSLLGVAATGPWTWTGSMDRLEDQVRKSIATTMHGTKPAEGQVADLTAYLATLAPPSPRTWEKGTNDEAVARGREVFRSNKCASCHDAPEYTTPRKYDVGLVDEVGNREFNPPSLRAISRRDAFFHDGRVRSLQEVFAREHHPRGLELSTREVADLVAFLGTL
jgi:YVTN family beta-propeller protein